MTEWETARKCFLTNRAHSPKHILVSTRVHHVGEILKVCFSKLFLDCNNQHLEIIFFFLRSIKTCND